MADAGSHPPTETLPANGARFVEVEQLALASFVTTAELALIDRLELRFRASRASLLEARCKRQARFDEGAVPSLRTDTRSIRDSDWQVAPIPALVADRRVEITGPVERKMIVNALNSDARVFMADFEDNWRKHLDDDTIARFQNELGALGYRFQFITLAGFHALNYSMFKLASGYRDRQMAAYVELQQEEFDAEPAGYTAARHQREVGTGYFDQVNQVIAGRRSSLSALEGSTEAEQFSAKAVVPQAAVRVAA